MRFVPALVAVLIVGTGVAQPARAGAWLREPDTAFVSLTGTMRTSDGGVPEPEYGLYGEYGAAPRLTLGLDINERPGIAGHVLVFARVPVRQRPGNTRVSLELGIGANRRAGQWNGMIKTTLSVGRGFAGRRGNGWVNVDAALELRRPDPNPAFKLDATVGLSNGRRLRPLLQLESTHIAGRPLIWAVIPGVMIDGRNDATWVIGLERKTSGRTRLGLKFALWRKF